jgi:hypothetical protein
LEDIRTIRVLGDIRVPEDNVEEDTAPEIEDSDIEEDTPDIAGLCARNQHYLDAVKAKWNLQTHDLGNVENIQIIINPTASEMNYKLLHPSFYCDVNDLGNLEDLAKLVNAPANWRQTYDMLVATSGIIVRLFNTLNGLPEGCSEANVSISFAQLVTTVAAILNVHLTSEAETPTAVGGLLVDSNLFLRSNTDVHFLKNGRNVIASELKSASAFSDRAVWYRDSRGIQVLTAMYAYKCPTFLASQKQWKLLVLNSSSDGILTYPFDRTAGARAGSTLTKELSQTFLQAVCICILSDPEGAAIESGASALEAVTAKSTPKRKEQRDQAKRSAKRARPQGSAEQASRKARRQQADAGGRDPHSGEGAGRRWLGGDAGHRRVRVLADCDVRTIEGRVADAELASAPARRAADAAA